MNDIALSGLSYRHNRHLTDHRLVHWIQLLLTGFLLTLSLVSGSIQRHLEDNLQSMLGADMVVSRFHALSAEEHMALGSLAGQLSATRLLDVNVSNEAQWQRLQLKVVDDRYPVQGDLRVALRPGGAEFARQRGPGEGEIWVGSRLFTELGLRMGQTVSLAGVPLRLTAILQHEPDRLLEGHSVKMRAIVLERSIAGSTLAEARGRYRYLVAADAAQRERIGKWVGRQLKDAQVLDRHIGGHPLAGYWERVENFFGLSSVLLFLLAAVALKLTTRRQLAAQQRRFALYLSMGVGPLRGLRLALLEWLIACIAAVLPAIALAYGLQYLFVAELQAYFPGLKPGWQLAALLRALLLILLLFFCTQVPSLYTLYRTSVISLIRQQPGGRRALGQLTWSLITLALLCAAYSDNWRLSLLVLTAMLAAVLLMLLLTWLVLSIGERVGRHRSGLCSFVFFIMKSRLLSKSTQVMGLGLCATLLLFTLMLMRDIGDSMFSHTRSHNGNLIVSEALQPQLAGIEQWAGETGSLIKDMRPFQRARLLRVNGRLPLDHAGHPSESLDVVKEPIRLSWSGQVPDNNRVVDGTWWSAADPHWRQISVEAEVMIDLELELGDLLTFQIADREFDFRIVASHAVLPGRSAVTFWFMAPPSVVEKLPAPLRAMGSMELSDSAWPELPRLLARYPTLSVVSLRELTRRFDATLAIVTRLTVFYTGMVLLLSIGVLLASIIGFEADDRRRHGLLKSLGLSDQGCLRLVLYEWLFTGALAAVGAIAGTWLAGQLIYQSQFQLRYQPDPVWLLASLSFSCLLVCTLGVGFSRGSLRAPIRLLLTA